jgi:hypothetical protein
MAEPMPWYQNAYRRNVIDMHITADDPGFLSEFDPPSYVKLLQAAKVQSTVLYAVSHVGLCLYPTRVGEVHPALIRRGEGSDYFGETLRLCHAAGIKVVCYVSLIHDLWAYRAHPDWKMCLPSGEPAAEHSRYGVCCPNSPYRDYVQQIAEELCTRYDFDGIRFDMTFWPRVCYCRHCRDRFAREVGGELPVVIDWENPRWVAFQRARERWLAEFAEMTTATARRFRPGVSVEHQASTFPLNWRFGVSADLAPANDFLQGDFYGDAMQGSFVRKLLTSLSPKRPIGFETSIMVDLGNVTALKSEDLLACKAAAALADGTAFIMIDSIDPVGTLNPRVYEREGRTFDRMIRYEPELGGDRAADVGVYFSTESKYDPADNGKGVDDPSGSGRMPHVEAVLGACKALLDRHVPFTVITRRNLGEFNRCRAILLPNVLMLSAEEAAALREYVRAGGQLYASGSTSLQAEDGRRSGDFSLADVFGVSYRGETKEKFTYIAPAPGRGGLFGEYSSQYPVGFYASQIKIEAHAETETLGLLTLPYTDPAEPRTFSSTHNNPPGRWTDAPAVTVHPYGQGRCVYAAIDLESTETARQVFTNLLEWLAGPFSLEADAPKAVEITVFHQPERQRTLVHLLNFQKELPNIPAEGIRLRLRVEAGRQVRRVRVLPDGEDVAFLAADGRVEFCAPRLETYLMLAVEY